MKKKAKRQSHHVIAGITSIVSAIVIGMGIISLLTYLGMDHFQGHMINPATLLAPKPKPAKTPPPLALQITPKIDIDHPDTHLPLTVDGMAPVVYDLPTDQPVVFLTIDDGAHKSPDEMQSILDNHLHASLFLARLFIDDKPDFFKSFPAAGNLIENHSLDHLTDDSDIGNYDVQHAQICGMADYEQDHYGRRPVFFRPPGGAYSDAMRRAAADCGMKAIVTWIAKANGGSMQYQIGDHLRPGDIVLMHFRPEFQDDLKAFMDAMNAQKLHTELLENWLQ